MLDFRNYELNIQSVRTQTNTKYIIQNTTYKYTCKYNYAANESKSVD